MESKIIWAGVFLMLVLYAAAWAVSGSPPEDNLYKAAKRKSLKGKRKSLKGKRDAGRDGR